MFQFHKVQLTLRSMGYSGQLHIVFQFHKVQLTLATKLQKRITI